MTSNIFFSEDIKMEFSITSKFLYEYFLNDIKVNHNDLLLCDRDIRQKISSFVDDSMNYYDNNKLLMDDNMIFSMILSDYKLQFGFSVPTYFQDLIEKMYNSFDEYDNLEFYIFCFKMRSEFLDNNFLINNQDFDIEDNRFKSFAQNKLLLFINDYNVIYNLNSKYSIFLLGSLL